MSYASYLDEHSKVLLFVTFIITPLVLLLLSLLFLKPYLNMKCSKIQLERHVTFSPLCITKIKPKTPSAKQFRLNRSQSTPMVVDVDKNIVNTNKDNEVLIRKQNDIVHLLNNVNRSKSHRALTNAVTAKRPKARRARTTPSIEVKQAQKRRSTSQGKSPRRQSNRLRFPEPYIFSLKGPILFTAPHSISVLRRISEDSLFTKQATKGIHENPINLQSSASIANNAENENESNYNDLLEDNDNGNGSAATTAMKKAKDPKLEMHGMEKHTAEIALKLSIAVSKLLNIQPSFMIWNLFSGFKETNFDPNYLKPEWFAKSEWHLALHKYKAMCTPSHSGPNVPSLPLPLLHIDLHGRQNRVNDINLDIGYRAMHECWQNSNSESNSESNCNSGESINAENDHNVTNVFISKLKQYFTDFLNPILKELGNEFVLSSKKDPSQTALGMQVELFPRYEGFRGHRCEGHTMVHQSALMGIPGIQLEMCTLLRHELMTNQTLLQNVAQFIASFYTDFLIVEYKKVQQLMLNSGSSSVTYFNEINNRGCIHNCEIGLLLAEIENGDVQYRKNRIKAAVDDDNSAEEHQRNKQRFSEYMSVVCNHELNIEQCEELLAKLKNMTAVNVHSCKGVLWWKNYKRQRKRKKRGRGFKKRRKSVSTTKEYVFRFG